MRFPWAILKPKELKNPYKSFFLPKRSFQSERCCARLCIRASCMPRRRKRLLLPSWRMRCQLQGAKNYTCGGKQTNKQKTCSTSPFLASLISKNSSELTAGLNFPKGSPMSAWRWVGCKLWVTEVLSEETVPSAAIILRGSDTAATSPGAISLKLGLQG